MAATLVWASEAGCAGVGGLGRCGGEQGTGGDAVHPRPLLLRHVLADLRVGMSTHHAGRAAPMLIAVGSERLDLLYSFAARPATTITDTNVAQRATARCGNSRYTQVLPGRRPLERAAGRDNSRDSATAWHHRPGSSAARIRARGRRTKRANTPRRHHARPEQACQRLLHPPLPQASRQNACALLLDSYVRPILRICGKSPQTQHLRARQLSIFASKR